MEVAMQRNLSAATAGPAISADSGPRDPAAIFRRLERRPRGSPLWTTAVAAAVVAIAIAGGVILFPNDFRSIAAHLHFLAAAHLLGS
jgi:hypothetical protein